MAIRKVIDWVRSTPNQVVKVVLTGREKSQLAVPAEYKAPKSA